MCMGSQIFFILYTKLGIKNFEWHLVLKCHICLHKYILEEMDFLDISLLGETYVYAANIEQKFKQMRSDFGFMNPK